MATPNMRPGKYPAILSYGFRPFFLLGALYSGGIILFWLPVFYGWLETSSTFAPVDWHVHEMLFGYLAAVITGFLLTAIPNWTGRLPVRGLSLLALVLLWIAGRVAVFFSADIGWLAAAIIDCAFLFAVAGAAAAEIVAGHNWRNLKVLVPLIVLLAANVVIHVEAHIDGVADVGRRLSIAAAIVLIMIIGGRIIPSFTRNWLVRENPGRLPATFDRFDMAVLVISTAALAGWTFVPFEKATGLLLLVAGLLNIARLLRWAGDRTWRDALVLVLHLAYLFVPIGLLLAGLAALDPGEFPSAAAVHAFGAGAIGCMTLAVMTRVSLGHTGHALSADGSTSAIYVAIGLAALLRISAAFLPALPVLLEASAALWALAFLGYATLYAGKLVRPRFDGKEVRG